MTARGEKGARLLPNFDEINRESRRSTLSDDPDLSVNMSNMNGDRNSLTRKPQSSNVRDDIVPNRDGEVWFYAPDVNHTALLAENLRKIYMQPEHTDVVFVVDNERIPAHKIILAASSEYFNAMLYGGLKETAQDEIWMKDVPSEAFKELLKYIYTGQLCFSQLKLEVILDTLGLAHLYNFTKLEEAISVYLRCQLSSLNVCTILEAAKLYELKLLTVVCYRLVEKNASNVLKHESFLSLSKQTVKDLLQRNTLYAPETEIFHAVRKWIEANCTYDSGSSSIVGVVDNKPYENTTKKDTLENEHEDLLSVVRLSLMTTWELLTIVRPVQLFCPNALLDAIAQRESTDVNSLPHRGVLFRNENVATHSHGAYVVSGEQREALLSGEHENYDTDRGFTRHTIGESVMPSTANAITERSGIIVKLGTPCIINHIKLLLWDRDVRAYSYVIEVSIACKDWVRVIDYQKYLCRSWQYLYFEPRVVQYIRIVGTKNTANRIFHAVSLEAMFTNSVPKLVNDIIVPSFNVTTKERGATVIEGVSRSRDVLLNGDTSVYDWDSGYTCHQLSSGAIRVQLAQPYILSSMRLLLWDCDDRYYSYYVETSVDNWEWEMVADRRHAKCRSWQTLTFQPRPVVYIRITGTRNTANEVFHCVHLESPASTECTLTQPTDGFDSDEDICIELYHDKKISPTKRKRGSPIASTSESDCCHTERSRDSGFNSDELWKALRDESQRAHSSSTCADFYPSHQPNADNLDDVLNEPGISDTRSRSNSNLGPSSETSEDGIEF